MKIESARSEGVLCNHVTLKYFPLGAVILFSVVVPSSQRRVAKHFKLSIIDEFSSFGYMHLNLFWTGREMQGNCSFSVSNLQRRDLCYKVWG